MIQKLLGQQKKIILFDGACNLCDRWVQTLLKNDPHDTFRFASLQSDIGREIQNTYGIDTQQIDSIIVIDGYLGYKTKTAALFSILSDMGGLWPLLQIFWIKFDNRNIRWFSKT